jgi:hypothetical protein
MKSSWSLGKRVAICVMESTDHADAAKSMVYEIK